MVLLLPLNVPVNGLVFVPMSVQGVKLALAPVFNSPFSFNTLLLRMMSYTRMALAPGCGSVVTGETPFTHLANQYSCHWLVIW